VDGVGDSSLTHEVDAQIRHTPLWGMCVCCAHEWPQAVHRPWKSVKLQPLQVHAVHCSMQSLRRCKDAVRKTKSVAIKVFLRSYRVCTVPCTMCRCRSEHINCNAEESSGPSKPTSTRAPTDSLGRIYSSVYLQHEHRYAHHSKSSTAPEICVQNHTHMRAVSCHLYPAPAITTI
jgi:hypothetical protein